MQGLLIAVAFLVCSPSTSLGDNDLFFEKNPPLSLCEISGVGRQKEKEIRQWLSVMPDRVQLSIDLIEIHYDYDNFEGNKVGYCLRREKTGKIEIHILFESLDPETLWHEAQHAYDICRNKIGEARWRGAAGKGYKNPDRNYPSRGVLTRYGATSWIEDKAEWAKKIYEYLSGRGNIFTKIKDHSDPRYLKKLEILRDDGSISDEDYDKIATLFNQV